MNNSCIYGYSFFNDKGLIRKDLLNHEYNKILYETSLGFSHWMVFLEGLYRLF